VYRLIFRGLWTINSYNLLVPWLARLHEGLVAGIVESLNTAIALLGRMTSVSLQRGNSVGGRMGSGRVGGAPG
jgi:hypothetical protein